MERIYTHTHIHMYIRMCRGIGVGRLSLQGLGLWAHIGCGVNLLWWRDLGYLAPTSCSTC